MLVFHGRVWGWGLYHLTCTGVIVTRPGSQLSPVPCLTTRHVGQPRSGVHPAVVYDGTGGGCQPVPQLVRWTGVGQGGQVASQEASHMRGSH